MRVVIAEDQALLRDGLARLFEDAATRWSPRSVTPTGCAPRCSEHEPDLAVVDVRMPPTLHRRGHRAPRAGSATPHPDVGVLVLSQHVEAAAPSGSSSQGGFGYLLKDRVLDVGDFIEAAERVAAAARRSTRRSSSSLVGGEATDALAELTAREREVLALMAEGLTNAASRAGWC